MAEMPDPELMSRLVQSQAWQEYLAALLAQYRHVERMLDHTEDDHRYWQGIKRGLTLAISWPYNVADLTTPLEAPEGARIEKKPKPPKREEDEPFEMPRAERRGYSV